MHDVWCLLCIFRVSFYQAEADDAGGIIPVTLTEQTSPNHRSMQGTNQKNPRFVALDGEPGVNACCCIHQNRSSTFREFPVSEENGVVN